MPRSGFRRSTLNAPVANTFGPAKFVEQDIVVQATHSGRHSLLSLLNKGDGLFERRTSRVTYTGIRMQGKCYLGDNDIVSGTRILKMWIVKDCLPSATIPAFNEVFDMTSSEPLSAYVQTNMMDRFIVIHSQIFQFVNTSRGSVAHEAGPYRINEVPLDLYLNLRRPGRKVNTHYKQGITSGSYENHTRNAIIVYLATSNSTVEFTCNLRMYFFEHARGRIGGDGMVIGNVSVPFNPGGFGSSLGPDDPGSGGMGSGGVVVRDVVGVGGGSRYVPSGGVVGGDVAFGSDIASGSRRVEVLEPPILGSNIDLSGRVLNVATSSEMSLPPPKPDDVVYVGKRKGFVDRSSSSARIEFKKPNLGEGIVYNPKDNQYYDHKGIIPRHSSEHPNNRL